MSFESGRIIECESCGDRFDDRKNLVEHEVTKHDLPREQAWREVEQRYPGAERS